MRAAGAEARRVLLELAAEQLKVPQERLVADNGVIYDSQQKDKRVTYGELAQGKTIARRAKEKPTLKKPSEFKVMNKSFLHRDSVEKVTGKAQYAGDIRLPGMLYAKLLRPPAHGAKLKNVDTSAAEKIEGVTVVHEGDLVAVLHKNPDQAAEALSKVVAEFDPSPSQVNDQTIFDHLLKNAGNGNTVAKGGDLEEGQKLAEIVVEQTYLDGYKAHSSMETHTALAQVEGNKATVWISTQTPFPTKDQIVRALGFEADNVRVITPFVGGGFGGKSAGQQAIEAAQLSKATGKPVQVCWSREEEFFFDTFRPAAVVKIKSGITKEGKAGALGLQRLLRGRPRRSAVLRHPESSNDQLGRRLRRFARTPLCHRRLACPRQQHQLLRPRVPDRHHGRQGQDGPDRVSPQEPQRRKSDPRPQGRRREVRLEARPRAQRPGTGRGGRDRLRHLRGGDRRGPGR